MKHLEIVRQILRESESVHPVSAAQAELLAAHLELVLDRNSSLNLTAVVDPEEAIIRHVVDSLSVVPLVQEAPPGNLADLGSGAGFPGIPLALVTARHTTLVESIGKKASFLAEVVTTLGLDIEVANARAEDWAVERPAAYSVVVARALTALPSLVELAAPLLARGGRLVALKGRLSGEELARGSRAAEIVGLEPVEMRPLDVPGGEARVAAVFQSTKASQRPLPRRVGMAQRRPLA